MAAQLAASPAPAGGAPLPSLLPPAVLGLRGGFPRPRSRVAPAGLRLGGGAAGCPRSHRRHRGGGLPAGPGQAGFPPSSAPVALRSPLRAAFHPAPCGAGPGAPLQGRPPPPAAAGGGREASPTALQASLPRRPGRCLRPARRARLRTHRRGDSLPQPVGLGQAHVRTRLPRKRYATMAAKAELGGVPPSRASAPPRGRGLSAALSGPRGRARAAGGTRREAGDQPLSWGHCGARPGRAGPRSRRGPPSERGEGPGAV